MKEFITVLMLSLMVTGLLPRSYGKTVSPINDQMRDTVPVQTLRSVQVKVVDLEDNVGLDSAEVLIGAQKKYTDAAGVVQFDSVPPSSTVNVNRKSYLGDFKKVKGASVVLRLIKDDRGGVSVVSNGFYTRPADYFSGAATEISGEQLRRWSPVDFTTAIGAFDPSFRSIRDAAGKGAPNGRNILSLRGATGLPELNSSAVRPSAADFMQDQTEHPGQPIVVVDGVQMSWQNVLDMDINRIKKLTLLKDAAATAVYGIRGSGGVVLIETNNGEKGSLRVTYNGQVSIEKADLSPYNLMNATEKLQLENRAGMYQINPDLYQRRQDAVAAGVNTDWLALPLKTAVSNKQYLSMQGGNSDLTYGLDFSYKDLRGVMKGEKRQGVNFGGYVSARIKHVTISDYISYMEINAAQSPYGRFKDYTMQNSYWDPYDPETGIMRKDLEDNMDINGAANFYNPAYNGTLATTNAHKYNRLSNNTLIKWLIGRGFSFNARLSFSRQTDEQNYFLPPGHTAFADYSPDDFYLRGLYDRTSNLFLDFQGNTSLDYQRSWGLSRLYATIGLDAMESRSESTKIELVGFSSDHFSDLAFGSAYKNSKPAAGKDIIRMGSAYGNFTYSYDNRYQVELTGTRDGSSQFGSNEMMTTNWATGVSWNLHQEQFFQENALLQQFRLHASIGTSGNQYLQPYLARTGYDYYTNRQYLQAGNGLGTRGIGLGAYLISYGNPNLRRPQTDKANIGLDAVLFKSSLNFHLSAYRNTTTALILPTLSDVSTGFQQFTYYENQAGVESRGVEFSLNWRVLQKEQSGFSWSIFLNGLHNEDQLTRSSDYITAINNASDAVTTDQTRPGLHFVPGSSLTGIWAVRSLGIDPQTGEEQFLTKDGSKTFTWAAADKVLVGDFAPKWAGSFGTSLSLARLTAGVYFNYQYGSQYYDQALADMENADLTYNVDRRAASSRWEKAGDQTKYKALYLNGLEANPTYVSSRFVSSSDYIRCAAITVDYRLPERLFHITGSAFKIGATINNAFSSAAKEYEQASIYPLTRQYTFYVNATF